MACLRQLSQREAKEVCENASAAAEELNKRRQSSYAVVMGDKGLEGIDFKVWSRARFCACCAFFITYSSIERSSGYVTLPW